jgi:hypothetical protein
MREITTPYEIPPCEDYIELYDANLQPNFDIIVPKGVDVDDILAGSGSKAKFQCGGVIVLKPRFEGRFQPLFLQVGVWGALSVEFSLVQKTHYGTETIIKEVGEKFGISLFSTYIY